MEKIRLGTIGISNHFMNRIMLPLTQSASIELVAVASRNLDKAQKAADKWQIQKVYDCYEALLDDPEVDAVYIPLPNHLHLEWVKKCVDAGKHVLCEKPLTMTADETETLIQYAEGKDVMIMEAFMYRFHPKWQMVRELVQTNGIGTVKSVHTMFAYSNSDPKNIRNIKAYGGGALMDIGCYAISSARWIMGADPIRVMGLNTFSEVFETDILSSGVLDFGEARSLFTVSTGLYPVQEIKAYGTAGHLEVLIPFNDHYDTPGQVKVHNALGTRVVEFEPTNQYGEMLDAFAKSIISGNDAPISLRDSYINMKIIDQLFASGKEGIWKKI